MAGEDVSSSRRRTVGGRADTTPDGSRETPACEKIPCVMGTRCLAFAVVDKTLQSEPFYGGHYDMESGFCCRAFSFLPESGIRIIATSRT